MGEIRLQTGDQPVFTEQAGAALHSAVLGLMDANDLVGFGLDVLYPLPGAEMWQEWPPSGKDLVS